MSEDQDALESFNGQTRLFPLPNLVLFPQVVQGLHIFETRYRQMMADSLETDMLMTLVLLKPGWEKDYDQRPAIEPIACLGRVGLHEKLPDGRYNLRLKGLSRLRILEEIPSDKLYRIARAELLVEQAPDDLAQISRLRKELAEVVLSRFPKEGMAYTQLQELIASDSPLGNVCDLLGYALPLPLELKQQLLEEVNVQTRVELLTDALRAKPAHRDRKFPPDFSVN